MPERPGPTLLVLAAGLGTRFGGLKQLEPLGPDGATLMDFSAYDAWRAGFARAVFVIRPEMAEDFERVVGRRYQSRLEVATAFQRLTDVPPGVRVPATRTKPWGTAQAVLAARERIEGPFAVINADDFYGRPALESVAAFLASGDVPAGTHGVVGYPLADTMSPVGGVNRAVLEQGSDRTLRNIVEVMGLVRRSDGRMTGRVDGAERHFDPETLVSMNLWGFHSSVLPILADGFARFLATRPDDRAEYCLPDAIREAVATRRLAVRVLPARTRWFGLTYPEDRAWVRPLLAELVTTGAYPATLWP